MNRKSIRSLRLLAFCSLHFFAYEGLWAQSSTQFDIVLTGGRVIDPETNLDAIRNVGITNGRVIQVTTEPIKGKETVNVSGLVVSPGFIDLHIHGIGNVEQEYQAHDGVTTALELEWGLTHLKEWYAFRESTALINYGASVSWSHARTIALDNQHDSCGDLKTKEAWSKVNWQTSEIFAQPSFYKALPPSSFPWLFTNMRNELEAGGIGIGVPIGYHPGATREEIFEVNKFAHERKAPIFMHVREGGALAVQQAIADASLTRASLHLVHLNSMALSEIKLCIEMVDAAQRQGLDITSEMYPYTAASTAIQSALFDPGWQSKFGISYNDLQWVLTGERLTEATFLKYRKAGGMVVMHMMKPEWIETGMKSHSLMIASDGMPYSKLTHPRTAGTFSRVLGKYVRQDKVLSLPDAIRKMSLMPAQRVQEMAPLMRLKGRIQVGTDADIVIFNPDTVIDKATFEKGLEFSEGIEYVLINGTFVIKNKKTVPNVFPGKAVYGKYKR
ncbi:MAG: amidohydrolase family protein [Chitinophagaceae bacterium]